MVGVVKGTLRPLAESISVAEAERAAKQVQEAIVKQQQQVNDLERFLAENNSLSELVLELPDAVSHPIMVPFGKAAFFPGRLIHTNEFLVLLGEGHYAERSAKQTVEILGRRSEFLQGKIMNTKAQVADLQAESSFAIDTAEEARSGLVEIREEYLGSSELQVNQPSSSDFSLAASSCQPNSMLQDDFGSDFLASAPSNSHVTAEDREYDRLMARISELELAEAAAGDSSSNEHSEEDDDDNDDDNNDNHLQGVMRPNHHNNIVSQEELNSEGEDYNSEETEEGLAGEEEQDDETTQSNPQEGTSAEDELTSADQSWNVGQTDAMARGRFKGLSRFARGVSSDNGGLDFQQVLLQHEDLKSAARTESARVLQKSEGISGFNEVQKELEVWRTDGRCNQGHVLGEREEGKSEIGIRSVKEHGRSTQVGEPIAAELKPFTGKVKEHSNEGLSTCNDEQASNPQPSRPISKFKMRQARAGK